MITITSSTETPEDMKAALVSHGITPVETEAKSADPEVSKTTEQPGEPGEKVPAEPASKTAPASEPEKKTQEEATEEPVKDPKDAKEPAKEPAKEKSKGGFQFKIDKLTKQAGELRDQLDTERGDKARLREQLAEVNAKLADLTKQPEAAGEKKEDGPVKPKRPTRASVDFDEDKYEAALEQYDTDLSQYHKAQSEQTAKEAVQADRRERAQAEQTRADNDFSKQTQTAGRKNYDDFDAMIEAAPDKSVVDHPTVGQYVRFKSKNPDALLYYFAKDLVENDGVEGARIAEMDDFDKVIALKDIEEQQVSERGAGKKGEPKSKPAGEEGKPEPEAPKKAAAAEEPKPPAKEIKPPAKTPDEPLETVGSRTSSTGDSYKNMADRGDSRAFGKKLLEDMSRRRPG